MANKHQYDVRITFQITKAGTGFKEVQNEIEKTDNVNKKATKSIIGKWTELRSQLLLIKFAVAEVSNAFDALWSNARVGAGLTQLKESFDRANEAIFKTPTLLNDMSAAARGTITEANLMSGIMTLTAGTSKELSQALTSNAADLLTIAKAANRLNPVLGNTDFFYQSLTQGIKRSSYRILDNLGIVVRVGEANKNWAAEMGRTVESLSAEERQMALLNEVLKVGGRLVEQAGGTSESLTDSYDILATATKEVANQGKQLLDSAIRPLIQGFADTRLAAIELRGEIERLFNQEFTSDFGANVDVQLSILEQKIEDFLADRGFASALIRGFQLDQATKDAVAGELADLFLQIEKSGDISQAATGFLSAAPDPDLSRYIESVGVLTAASNELGIETNNVGIVIAGQTILWREVAKAVEEMNLAETRSISIKARLATINNLNSTMNRQSAGLTNLQLEAVNQLNEENKLGATILSVLGLETKDQTESLRGYVLATAESYDNSEQLRRSLEALGFTVTDNAIFLGDFSISWKDLNRLLKENEENVARAATATAFLAAEEEYLAFASIDVAAGMDLMAARAENWANEAAGAAREVADELERLEEVELSNFFDQAASGDINFFNKELDELGTHMTWVSDSTVLQTDQVANLQKEYADITQTINDYNTFATGATLTDDERNKKIAEQYELLGVVGGKLSEVGELQGHYAEYVTQSVIDQDKLNDSMYDAIEAYSENAAETSRAGVALGIYNEEAAYQILQNALLAQGIERIAAEYGEGGKSVAWLTEQMRLLKEEVLSAPDPADAVTIDPETAAATAQAYKDALNRKFDETEDLRIPIPEPDTTLFDTYMIDTFGEGGTAANPEINIVTNATTVLDDELTPVKAWYDEIVLGSPYEADLDTNTAVEKTLLESYGLYFFGLNGKSVTTTVTTNFVENNRPAPYNPFPGPGNATGADYIVPPGYPNESWSIGTASTGERVKIDTPAQQRAEGKNNNGLTVQFLGPVYGEDALMERIEESYAQKGRMAYNRSRGG